MQRQILPVPFGPPMQSLEAAQRREGMSGEFYNVFRDRDGGLRRRPGFQIFKDFNEAGRPILGLYEPIQSAQGPDILVLRNGASAGVLARLSLAGAALTLTPSSFVNNVLATFTETPAGEGRTYAANGGPINRIHMNTPVAQPNIVFPITIGNAPANVTHVGFAKTYLISNGLISGGISGDTNFSNDGGNLYQAAASWRFFNNEQRPDACNGLVIDHDEIAAWGSRSIEISHASASPPWSTASGAFFPYGVLANYSVQWLGGELIFLSTVDRQPHFVRIRERQPEILSGPYDGFLAGLTAAQLAACQGHVIAFAGMVFYVAQFPGVATLIFNPQWKEWYRWSSFAAGVHQPWVINCAEYIESFNKMLVGDKTDAKIWELLLSLRSDAGTAIQVQLNSGQIRRGTSNRKRCVNYRATFKRGSVSDGTTPQVGIRFNDEGQGFGTQRFMSLGAAGASYMTYQLNGCGIYVDREIELTHSGVNSEFILVSMEEEFDILST